MYRSGYLQIASVCKFSLVISINCFYYCLREYKYYQIIHFGDFHERRLHVNNVERLISMFMDPVLGRPKLSTGTYPNNVPYKGSLK